MCVCVCVCVCVSVCVCVCLCVCVWCVWLDLRNPSILYGRTNFSPIFDGWIHKLTIQVCTTPKNIISLPEACYDQTSTSTDFVFKWLHLPSQADNWLGIATWLVGNILATFCDMWSSKRFPFMPFWLFKFFDMEPNTSWLPISLTHLPHPPPLYWLALKINYVHI